MSLHANYSELFFTRLDRNVEPDRIETNSRVSVSVQVAVAQITQPSRTEHGGRADRGASRMNQTDSIKHLLASIG